MGWGVDYTYHGYIRNMTKEQLSGELEDCEGRIELAWRELLAYAQQTPPAYTTPEDDEDTPEPWPEFLARKFGQLRRDLEEDYGDSHRYQDCLDTMSEHPEDVTES